jgi:hypothetical protein
LTGPGMEPAVVGTLSTVMTARLGLPGAEGVRRPGPRGSTARLRPWETVHSPGVCWSMDA